MAGRAQRVHSRPDPWGRDTAKQNATANSNPEDHTECGPVRAQAQGGQREEQADPPQKKNSGGGGERTAHSHQTAHQHRKRRPNPPPRGHRRQDRGRGTGSNPAKSGNTEPGAAADRKKGHPKRADTHHAGKKKKKSQQPSPKERGWGGRDHKAWDRDSQRPRPQSQSKTRPPKKNTPRQPNQEGRGTAETRAQHARPHGTPQPGKAGNKRGAGTNTHTTPRPSREWRGVAATTHPRTATPTRRCGGPRGTGTQAHTHPNTPPRSGGAQPKPRSQHARPHRTPEPGTGGSWQLGRMGVPRGGGAARDPLHPHAYLKGVCVSGGMRV